MIPKKGDFSAIFTQNQMYSFAGDAMSNKSTKISLGLLTNSGLELKIGKYLNKDDISVDLKGIAFHIKKKLKHEEHGLSFQLGSNQAFVQRLLFLQIYN